MAESPALYHRHGAVGLSGHHGPTLLSPVAAPGHAAVPGGLHAAADQLTPAWQEQHRRLVAHCLAQSRTLMVGRSQEAARLALAQRGLGEAEASRLAPHLAMPRQPSQQRDHHGLRSSRDTWRAVGLVRTPHLLQRPCGASTPSINGVWNWARKSARTFWRDCQARAMAQRDGRFHRAPDEEPGRTPRGRRCTA